MENIIHDTISELFSQIGCHVTKIKLDKEEDNLYRINLSVTEPNLMIGYHGENIKALQHLLKLILVSKTEEHFDIYLDIDSYRKRQEENILNLAERKVEMVRKYSISQNLPAMSPYFRRLVHLHLAQDKYKDISTESKGEGEHRYIIIKPELII